MSHVAGNVNNTFSINGVITNWTTVTVPNLYKGKCWLKRAGYKLLIGGSANNKISAKMERGKDVVPVDSTIDKGCGCDKLSCDSGFSGQWGDNCAGPNCG